MDIVGITTSITAQQAELCAQLPTVHFTMSKGIWQCPELVPVVADTVTRVSTVQLEVHRETIHVEVPETLLQPMAPELSTMLFCAPLYLRDVLPLIVRYAVANNDSSAISLLSVNKALYKLWTQDGYISAPLLPGKLMMKHQWDMHDWIMKLSRRTEYPLCEFMPQPHRPGISHNQYSVIEKDVDLSPHWKPTFVISAPTGTGKTVAIFSSALAMAQEDTDKLPFLIVSPPTVAYSVYQTLYRQLFGPDDDMTVLYGKVNPNTDLSRYRFIIVSSYTMGRPSKVIKLLIAKIPKFRCVYVDEYDCALGKSGAEFLNSLNTPMRIMLSATAIKSSYLQAETSLYGFTAHAPTAAATLAANRGHTLTVNGNHMKAVTQYTQYRYSATGIWFPEFQEYDQLYLNASCGMGAKLLALLQSRPRMLVYCTSHEMLAHVELFIRTSLPELSVYAVNGSSEKFRDRIAMFTSCQKGVMLTIVSTASRGINIHQVVDTVIMIGAPMTIDANLQQCSGRLMRLGKKQECEMHLFELPNDSDVLAMHTANQLAETMHWSPYTLAYVSSRKSFASQTISNAMTAWGWGNHVAALPGAWCIDNVTILMILDGEITIDNAMAYRSHFGIIKQTPRFLNECLQRYPQHEQLLRMIFG